MELLFEKSTPGHGCDIFPACDVPVTSLPEALARKSALPLPELSETEISRHYTALANRAHGVNNGFYPLGSCTMKYNPRIDEDVAARALTTRWQTRQVLPPFIRCSPKKPYRAARKRWKF